MPSEENSASGPAGPYHTEYQGDSESLELNESVYDGDISDDLTDNELQDAELSERLHQEVSDYFSRNVMDRQHIFGAFRLYERILIEHRGRSNSRVLRAADFREQVAGFSNVFMRYLIHVRNPAIKLGTRDQAIDNLLIPAPVDETQAELEPCPICNETFEAATGDGKSRTNHEACMLPDCKHVFGRECIGKWLKKAGKNTCPMCRAKIDLSSFRASNTFKGLRELMAGVRR